MRKTAYFASAALVAMSAIAVSCSKNVESNTDGDLNAPAATVANDSTGAHATVLSRYVRYVDTQKILASYTLAREVAQADSTAQIKLAAYQNQLSNNLNSRAQKIQEKMQRNGYLTEASYNADMTALQKLQQDAEASLAQRQRDYAADVMTKQQQLNDSVRSVVNDICIALGLDAVLDRQAGLYFNPTLDITDQVIEELNRRYKSDK